MNVPSLVVMTVIGLICAAVALVRLRRRRYLLANRPRVIKESLERARAKQIGQGPPGSPPGKKDRRETDKGPGGAPRERGLP